VIGDSPHAHSRTATPVSAPAAAGVRVNRGTITEMSKPREAREQENLPPAVRLP
jgi:hypothetical protein